jgi:Family of unknown function (DUF6516)
VVKKISSLRTTSETHRLKGKRKGALLKEQVWFENEEVVAYSLAYINLRRCSVDNGRVLGYDSSHDFHHRHFMGAVEAIGFTTYAALVERFIGEVHELWRLEDEEKQRHHQDG